MMVRPCRSYLGSSADIHSPTPGEPRSAKLCASSTEQKLMQAEDKKPRRIAGAKRRGRNREEANTMSEVTLARSFCQSFFSRNDRAVFSSDSSLKARFTP